MSQALLALVAFSADLNFRSDSVPQNMTKTYKISHNFCSF